MAGNVDKAEALEVMVAKLFRFCEKFGLAMPSTREVMIMLFLIEESIGRYDAQMETWVGEKIKALDAESKAFTP